jgi:hypothetical protein
MSDKPVNYVNFWDGARFANWLHNNQPTGGQGNGTTETGAYTLGSVIYPNNSSVTRNSSARWFLPAENEWYKAAYYNPATASYFAYPSSSETAPSIAAATATGDVSNPGSNVANYLSGADWNGQEGNVTTVGSAGATSPYGTFDQGGNVYEWNESRRLQGRYVRGGAWGESAVGLLASVRTDVDAAFESNFLGFRVARTPQAEDFGDYNHDGLIDAADYVTWRRNDATPTGYNLWRQNFGISMSTGSVPPTQLPEPRAGLLWFIAAMILLIAARPGSVRGSGAMMRTYRIDSTNPA